MTVSLSNETLTKQNKMLPAYQPIPTLPNSEELIVGVNTKRIKTHPRKQMTNELVNEIMTLGRTKSLILSSFDSSKMPSFKGFSICNLEEIALIRRMCAEREDFIALETIMSNYTLMSNKILIQNLNKEEEKMRQQQRKIEILKQLSTLPVDSPLGPALREELILLSPPTDGNRKRTNKGMSVEDVDISVQVLSAKSSLEQKPEFKKKKEEDYPREEEDYPRMKPKPLTKTQSIRQHQYSLIRPAKTKAKERIRAIESDGESDPENLHLDSLYVDDDDL
jgi:hypothetical protein